MSRARQSFPTWPEAVAALRGYVPTAQRSLEVELAAAREQGRQRHRKQAITGGLIVFAAISFLMIFRGIFAQKDLNAELQALCFIFFALSVGLGINGLWFLLPGRLATITADCEQEVRDLFGPARGPDLVIVNDLVTSSAEARDIVRAWLDTAGNLSAEDVQMLLLTYDAWHAERVRQRFTDTERGGIATLADLHTKQAHAHAGVVNRSD